MKTEEKLFWLLVADFIFVMAVIFLQFKIGSIFLPSIILFMALGGMLLYRSWRKDRWMMLTGSSTIMFVLSIFLHNFFYALTVLSENINILQHAMEALHVFFFIFGLIACPIGFLLGVIGVVMEKYA